MNTSTRYRRGRSGPRSNKRRTFSSGTSRGRGSRSTHQHRNSARRPRAQGNRRNQPTFDPSQFINTNPVDVIEEVYKPQHSFKTIGLSPKLAYTIAKMGITAPTPIQDQIIPHILKGHDVIGLAETGTGKTAAFLAPLIEKTLKEYNRQTLVLVPTRELAIQIEEELRKLSAGLRIFSTVCVGGVNINPQIRALKRDNHFIIGTPGRILDLIKQKYMRTDMITTVVLDEADRMLDMGFIVDMRKILEATPKERETLFFSATMSKDIEHIVHNFLRNPVTVSVKKKDVTNSIKQDIVSYRHDEKFKTLATLLRDPEFKRVLIFGSMKHSVEKLAKQLSQNGIQADSIHGNKNHSQRQRSLTKFKNGDVRVLVATDVAARGIHVESVTHVINYDMPNTFEDYVHRIGRTGRADKRGKALTFVPADRVQLGRS